VVACVGRELWWRGRGGGGGGMRGSEPNCDRDLVDGDLKLRSPSKIAFDINTFTPDDRFYFTITLGVV
jgi:hypothetical protein